jgi:hypothetical protein
MSRWGCPLGRPIGVAGLRRFAWSEASFRIITAATFTPMRWAK